MPRKGNYNSLDVPVVEYIPGFNPAIAGMQAEQLAGVNKRWDETEQAVANAIAEYGSLPVRDTEAPIVKQKIADFNKYVQDTVSKYGGRYDLAAGDIARKMANEASFYSKAKQIYDQQKQYEPLYAKYAQNLLFKGQDPRKQAAFDEQGNFIGTPDFTPYERSQYGDVIYDDLGKAIDSMVKEGKLKQADVPWLMENITTRGLSAITNPELRQRVEAYVPEFVNKTTFGFDPTMEQYRQDPRSFVEQQLRSRVSSGLQRGYQEDWGYKQGVEEANRRAREAAKRNQDLSDIYVFGAGAQDVVENPFLDEAPSVSEALSLSDIPANKVNIKASKIRLNKIIAEEQAKFNDKNTDPVVKARVIGPKLFTAKNDLKKLESIEPILEKNKELFKTKMGREAATDYELAQFIDKDSEAVSREYTYTRPILNPLTSKVLKTTVREMANAKFRIGDEDIIGTSLTDVSDKLGVKESILRGALDSEDYAPRYNTVSGEYYINVPTKAKMDKGKLVAEPNTSYKRLYFSPDETTAEYSLGLKSIKNAISSGSKSPLIVNPRGDIFSYRYNPEYPGAKSDKSAKKIEVIQNGQVVGLFSLSDLENHIEKINEVNLKEEYTKKWLPLSQQNKVE